MSALGHWFEAATAASLAVYHKQGIACVQFIATPANMTRSGSFYRKPSTVDYIGAWRGIPVAFDCKTTIHASLPHRNVHDHQLHFLRAFARAGGIAALLVCFERRAPSTFLVHINCYDDIRDQLGNARSVAHSRLVTAAQRFDELCVSIQHGRGGIPVPVGDALDALAVKHAQR